MNNDIPAFPVPGLQHGEDFNGMTLRDYFAAKCVSAMVSTIRRDDDYHRAKKIAEHHGMEHVSEWFAHDAYKQADAMLRARKAKP